jgi:hypothetical protein
MTIVPRASVRSSALIVAGLLFAGPTAAEDALSPLVGSWGGSGRITYTDGSTEGIRCTAYYTGGGSALGLSIKCNSEKNPIHVISKLRVSGSRASGDWEERTYTVSGSASGSVSPGSLSLAIEGGGVTGSMSVSFSKSSHTVTITTKGIAMARASMSFSRR